MSGLALVSKLKNSPEEGSEVSGVELHARKHTRSLLSFLLPSIHVCDGFGAGNRFQQMCLASSFWVAGGDPDFPTCEAMALLEIDNSVLHVYSLTQNAHKICKVSGTYINYFHHCSNRYFIFCMHQSI